MRNVQEGMSSSCVGALWSVLWSKNVTICGDTYRIVRRIGEGGTYVRSCLPVHEVLCVYTPGFSYVELVQREGRQYALVSENVMIHL